MDVKTHHSSLPIVENRHLSYKMPNVFTLHICYHISDQSLDLSGGKKKRSKQADLSASFLLGDLW